MNTEATTVQTSKHNWTQRGFVLGKTGVPNNVQVLLIKTVSKHEAGQLTNRLWLIENNCLQTQTIGANSLTINGRT